MAKISDVNLTPLIQAQQFLQDALKQAKSRLEIAGTIQAFEFSYELAWKTLKRVLAYRGIDVASPREVFRYAALEKLIIDPEVWFVYLKNRNMTVHVYNQDIADEIFTSLPQFLTSLNECIATLKLIVTEP